MIKKKIQNTILLFISLLIGLILSELGLRLYYNYSQLKFAVFPTNYQKIFNPVPGIMPGVSGKSRFSTNSWGIRGDGFDDSQQYRILVLGGSVAECVYLDDGEAWPYLLQKKLNGLKVYNVWVGNIGASGKTTRDSIMHLRYLLPQYPQIDTVIILVGVNDFGLRLIQGSMYDPHFLNTSDWEHEQVEHAFYIYPRLKFKYRKIWYKKTALWRTAKKVRDLFSPMVEDEAGEFYIVQREKRKNASVILDSLPDLTSALEEYTRNINAIIDIARQQSVRPIFLTQPYIWNDTMTPQEIDLCWYGFADRDKMVYSITALESGLQQYNEKLFEVCKKRGAEIIDLVKYLPKNTSVFYDDLHFNENGSAVVSNIIFDYLRQKEAFVKKREIY